jgi:serine/threonine protein kinase
MDKAQIDEVKCEAKILSSLTSQYIVKFYENFFEDNNLNIVMEYCDGGDLAKYLQNNYNTGKFIKEEKIWRFFIQIVIGSIYV